MRPAMLLGVAELHPYVSAAIFAGLAVASLHAGLRMTAVCLVLLCVTCLVADPDAPDASGVDLRADAGGDVGCRRSLFARGWHGEWQGAVRSRASDCAAWVGDRLPWPSEAKSTLGQGC